MTLSEDELDNDLHESELGFDACADCWNGTIAHCGKDGVEHVRWLRIDTETGEHVGVRRPVPEGSSLAKLGVEHLTLVFSGGENAAGETKSSEGTAAAAAAASTSPTTGDAETFGNDAEGRATFALVVSGSTDGEIRTMLKKEFGLGMGKAQKVLRSAKKLQKQLAPPPSPSIKCVSCLDDLDASNLGYWLPGCQKPLEHGKKPFCADCLLNKLLKKERFRQVSDGTISMPPSTYFCAPPPSGNVITDQPSCGRQVELDGLSAELVGLRTSFEKMKEDEEEGFMNVQDASLHLLLSCPSLYALREEEHPARIILIDSIQSHVDSLNDSVSNLNWVNMLPWFQQAMKNVHPQKHLMELVDTFV